MPFVFSRDQSLPPSHELCPPSWVRRCRRTVLAALTVGAAGAFAADDSPASKPEGDFLPDVQLAPFVVNGERLSISVHARNRGDRRYAEQFAEDVVAVTYETLERSPGAGLVVIGAEGEPHPIYVFRKFLAMADAGQLQPEVAAKATDLRTAMAEWEQAVDLDEDDEDAPDITFDMVVDAIPLPLEGIGSQLYQLAWAENFDVEQVELKLHALTAADLEGDALRRFDWVFYLPPRDAFNHVLKVIIPKAMEAEDMGFLKRAAVRSALVVFRPVIKKAIEGARKGMLFMTVFRSRSDYSREDIRALTGAYVQVLMPDFKLNGGSERRRAVEAVEAQKLRNIEKANDPFEVPPALEDYSAERYDAFVGEYAERRKTTHRLVRDGDTFTWQYLDWEPGVITPVGERKFANADRDMTIEFLVDADGNVTAAEERWENRRKTIRRKD